MSTTALAWVLVILAVFAGWAIHDFTRWLKRCWRQRRSLDYDDLPLIEVQILEMMAGFAASEDHKDVLEALQQLGITAEGAKRIHAKLAIREEWLVRVLADALERSQNGLQWYQDMYPDAASPADDEHAAETGQAQDAAELYLKIHQGKRRG